MDVLTFGATAALALLWIASAINAAVIAHAKGRSATGWLVAGVLLGVFAVLFAAALPPRERRRIVEGDAHSCPICRGPIHKDATVCMHCRQPLLLAAEQ